MDKKRTIRSDFSDFIDHSSGEVLASNVKHVNILVDTDEFMLIYARFWSLIRESPLSRADIDIASYVLEVYGNGQPFKITKYIKSIVGKQSGREPSTYNKSTGNLIKAGILLVVGVQTYKVNPQYAFKGSSKNRNKLVLELLEEKYKI